jgi:hypothetical protein
MQESYLGDLGRKGDMGKISQELGKDESATTAE